MNGQRVQPTSSPVLVNIFLDMEDYITPESDEPPLHIAQIAKKHGVTLVVKLVGEKLRVLQKRNRRDVIEAVSEHDMGYHSDKHNFHPTIIEYVESLEWDEGRSEFEKREGPGYEELKREFGPLSSYGHPGMSWIPQAYPVLKKWGIGVYIDETSTIVPPIKERPYWYGNLLNLMGLGRNLVALDASDGPANLPDDWLIKVKDQFSKAYERLKAAKDVGLIAMYIHPPTYATEEFFDIINFSRGKNPENGIYKVPRLKSAQRVKEDLANFERFLVFAKSLPFVRFITAKEALEIYHDKADGRGFSKAELKSLCHKNMRSIIYNTIGGGVWVSAAETFSMLTHSLGRFYETRTLPSSVKCLHPFGPKDDFGTMGRSREIDFEKFLQVCKQEYETTSKTGYVSTSTEVDGVNLAPADMFATCCFAYVALSGRKKLTKIRIKRGNFEVGKMVSDEGARIDWRHYANPEGFEAPRQTELARLQSWTLKPAVADPGKIAPGK